jgi:hypothetical protein
LEVARRKQPEGSRGVGFGGGWRVTGIYEGFPCGKVLLPNPSGSSCIA